MACRRSGRHTCELATPLAPYHHLLLCPHSSNSCILPIKPNEIMASKKSDVKVLKGQEGTPVTLFTFTVENRTHLSTHISSRRPRQAIHQTRMPSPLTLLTTIMYLISDQRGHFCAVNLLDESPLRRRRRFCESEGFCP